jgi:hypothetical protein
LPLFSCYSKDGVKRYDKKWIAEDASHLQQPSFYSSEARIKNEYSFPLQPPSPPNKKKSIKMVSSFIIETSISVSQKVAKHFNEMVETFDVKKAIHQVPSYFDQAWLEDGEDILDYFLSQERELSPLSIIVRDNNWRFSSDSGNLYDAFEKFHGSISMLHYFIDTYFEPLGIKLNGTVVGVNTSRAIAFVYRVQDNIITLDEEKTREYLRMYSLMMEDIDTTEDDVPFKEMFEYITKEL